MLFNNIKYNVANGTAVLSLNLPETLNSFTVAMHEDVQAAMLDVRTNEQVRCMVITGEGRGFCAGQDLKDLMGSGSEEPAELGEIVEK